MDRYKDVTGCRYKDIAGCRYKAVTGCRYKAVTGCRYKDVTGCQHKDGKYFSQRKARKIFGSDKNGFYAGLIPSQTIHTNLHFS